MESRLIGTDRDYYRLTDKPEIIGSSVGVSGKLACDHEIWKIADVIVQLANSDEVPVRLILGVDAESACNRLKLRVRARPKNGDISPFQRC